MTSPSAHERRRRAPAGAVVSAPARMPALRNDSWAWQADAACQDVNPDVFFAADSERGIRRRAKELLAKSLCATCPVEHNCRSYALAVGEAYGVWGGTTEYERGLNTGRDA